MQTKQIKITCKGSGRLPIDKLQTFQGNLKILEKTEFEKLKRSILKHGFSFPVFVWGNQLLDGHQRIFVLSHLITQEGYSVGEVPIVEIEASDEVEAAEKLLILNSHYAKITEDGLYEFLNEKSFDIENLADDLNLPDFNLPHFIDGWAGDPQTYSNNSSSSDIGDNDKNNDIENDPELDESRLRFPIVINFSDEEFVLWEKTKEKFKLISDKECLLRLLRRG